MALGCKILSKIRDIFNFYAQERLFKETHEGNILVINIQRAVARSTFGGGTNCKWG